MKVLLLIIAVLSTYCFISKPDWKIKTYCKVQAFTSGLKYTGYDFVINKDGAVRDISCHYGGK